MISHRRRLAVLLCTPLLLLGACSSDESSDEPQASAPVGADESSNSGDIDGVIVQEEIAGKIREGLPDLDPQVKCPENIPVSAGGTFTCEAKFADQNLSYTVTQTDDSGAVSWVPNQALLIIDEIQTKVAAQLSEEQGGSWTIECDPPGSGEGIFVVAPGSEFECSYSGKDTQGKRVENQVLDITVEDVEGNVEWKT